MPIIASTSDGTEICTFDTGLAQAVDSNQATAARVTQGSAACHSFNFTGTSLDLATCVIVKVLLPSNNLVGPLDAIDLLTSQHAMPLCISSTGSVPAC